MAPFVLVVEDDFTVKQTACRFLTQVGYACSSVGTATAALTALRAGTSPDVLVLDLRLPDLPGTEVAIRAQDWRPDTPVVFVSAYATEFADLPRLRNVRWQFLPKPFTADELVAAVGLFVPPPVN